MIREQIDSLANHLRDQKELIFKHGYTHVSVLLTRDEIEHILKHLYDHKEPTYEEIMDYCKARHLYLMTYSAYEQGRKYQPYDGMTNGDMIISLYPNLKYTIRNGRVLTTIGVASTFDIDWWNAPYQKGGDCE